MCVRGDEVVRVQVELTRPRRGVGGGRIRSATRDAAGRRRSFGRCETADDRTVACEEDTGAGRPLVNEGPVPKIWQLKFNKVFTIDLIK